MRYDDFFEEIPDADMPWADPSSTKRIIKMELIRSLARKRDPGDDELESAIALTRIVRAEYEAFGTAAIEVTLTEEEAREAPNASSYGSGSRWVKNPHEQDLYGVPDRFVCPLCLNVLTKNRHRSNIIVMAKLPSLLEEEEYGIP